jgi:RHS repeat-associated protein
MGTYDGLREPPCKALPPVNPGDHEVRPSELDSQQDTVRRPTHEVCLEMEWPAAYLWMTHLSRRSSAVGPLSWMGSLIQNKRDLTGQLYMRNRYYDPQTGRFTQEDPIGLAGGLNAYGFANGDPVSYSDPYGLCPKEAEEGSVCLDYFIGAETALAFKGDNRGFDPNASADQSRVQIVVNDGMLVSVTLSDTHLRDELGGGTLRALPWTPDGPNRVSTQRSRNGTFTVNVDLTVSVPGASALFPAINSSVTLPSRWERWIYHFR